MAIDTPSRRRSTIGVLPVTDSAIGAADRRQATWNYAGFVTSSATGTARRWTTMGAGTSVWLPRSSASSSWVASGAAAGTWVNTTSQGQD